MNLAHRGRLVVVTVALGTAIGTAMAVTLAAPSPESAALVITSAIRPRPGP
ncbi:MAG: hypothetical protein M3457_18150 [Chloroflexota bacterium]|nr:hypothetical protein [Chloroflexota bacterium]